MVFNLCKRKEKGIREERVGAIKGWPTILHTFDDDVIPPASSTRNDFIPST